MGGAPGAVGRRPAAAARSWVPAPGGGVPINQYQIHFESDLFEGRMLVYIKGLPSSYEPYFAGKKRRSVLMSRAASSGRCSCLTSSRVRSLTGPSRTCAAAGSWRRSCSAFARRVVSCLELGDVTRNPYMVFPLMALAHVVNVSPVGQEPPIDQATEDLRLWDPTLVDKKGAPMAAEARRKHFMNERHLEGRRYDTNHVWTFYIWQQVIDVAGYFLDLVVQQYDMVQHLDGQPLQVGDCMSMYKCDMYTCPNVVGMCVYTCFFACRVEGGCSSTTWCSTSTASRCSPWSSTSPAASTCSTWCTGTRSRSQRRSASPRSLQRPTPPRSRRRRRRPPQRRERAAAAARPAARPPLGRPARLFTARRAALSSF
ncbi:MAG: hypothetical protein J3K34DRAFT_194539 [Monoraphidium minutum]|nr:MAG: hypothetical protein J3K34DRAFT_194539 [Monoraphidium minutum]